MYAGDGDALLSRLACLALFALTEFLMLACLTRGEIFTGSVHSVPSQLFAHLANCPCFTAFVLVLGLLARVECLP
jgi:hypothetical protein